MELSKEDIAKELQFADFERCEYEKLVHSKIIPSLDIGIDEFKKLDIDMYQTVICKNICDMKEENEILKKYKKMINNLKSKYIVVFGGEDGCDIQIGDVELLKDKFSDVKESIDEQ